MISICSHSIVAEELIQKDDLILLFIGASSSCSLENTQWRDANFTFLCTIVSKALTSSVIKYIHCKEYLIIFLCNIKFSQRLHWALFKKSS